MAFNPILNVQDYSDEEFYGVINRLKRQHALPEDSFILNIPFFNFPLLSKEFQVKELFEESWDHNMLNAILRNIAPEELSSPCSPLTSLTAGRMMTFAQICLYKVLPCPNPNCSKRPREIVTHNQYKDYEYECPFYHHERDRRRLVISPTMDEEFTYKANYYEEGRSNAEKDKYSQNYFESMFHPLYYKMFRCKREYCNSCHSCPFYHNEQEKKNWDQMFSSFIKKDRITYVKDKQKYYESTSNTSTPLTKDTNSSGEQSQSPTKSPDYFERRPQKNFRNNKRQQQRSPQDHNQNRNPNIQPAKKMWGDWNNNEDICRKGSNDSFGMNTDPFGIFGNTNKQITSYRAC
jgi:hypothetical protein